MMKLLRDRNVKDLLKNLYSALGRSGTAPLLPKTPNVGMGSKNGNGVLKNSPSKWGGDRAPLQKVDSNRIPASFNADSRFLCGQRSGRSHARDNLVQSSTFLPAFRKNTRGRRNRLQGLHHQRPFNILRGMGADYGRHLCLDPF